jgi:hypothetical protein
MPRNTRVAGHGLIGGGAPPWRSAGGRARCECGALSEPSVTQAEARRWMVAHKAYVLQMRATEARDPR